ncbi:MAG: hypothetical protein EOP90_13560 [Lysobacteraceae bacterium]|nr:MAG: hypothetical protein EOP90_13560 [Xanthomonadaceae bacterium]
MNHEREPATATSVELARYLGTWYEIARKPLRFEGEDYTDITATYSLNDDGTIRVDNRALDGEGEPKQSVGQARVLEGSGNAKLEVSFLPEGLRWIPFTRGDYWILRVDREYRTALVGTPDRTNLWLLSRTPQPDSATRASFLGFAREQGFDLSDLIEPRHG